MNSQNKKTCVWIRRLSAPNSFSWLWRFCFIVAYYFVVISHAQVHERASAETFDNSLPRQPWNKSPIKVHGANLNISVRKTLGWSCERVTNWKIYFSYYYFMNGTSLCEHFYANTLIQGQVPFELNIFASTTW